MENITKTDVISRTASNTFLTKKEVKAVLEDLVYCIGLDLRVGNKVVLSGFGTFKTGKRRARVGRNPKLNKPMMLPGMTTIHFLPSKRLKKFVRSK